MAPSLLDLQSAGVLSSESFISVLDNKSFYGVFTLCTAISSRKLPKKLFVAEKKKRTRLPSLYYTPTTCNRTLRGHTGSFRAIIPFGEGKLISASDDCTVKVWDAASGACERTVPTMPPTCCACSLALFGDLLFVGLYNGSIQVVNMTTWTIERSLQGHTSDVASLVMCGDLLISGSYDHTIRVWSTATWACERTLRTVPLCSGARSAA